MNAETKYLLERIIESIAMLPRLMCDEMEKREEIRKTILKKQIEEQMEVYKGQIRETSRMMYNLNVSLGLDDKPSMPINSDEIKKVFDHCENPNE